MRMMTAVPGEALERLDAVDQQAMERFNTPGATLALTDGGRTLATRAYGYADIAAKTLATPDHLFELIVDGNCLHLRDAGATYPLGAAGESTFLVDTADRIRSTTRSNGTPIQDTTAPTTRGYRVFASSSSRDSYGWSSPARSTVSAVMVCCVRCRMARSASSRTAISTTAYGSTRSSMDRHYAFISQVHRTTGFSHRNDVGDEATRSTDEDKGLTE